MISKEFHDRCKRIIIDLGLGDEGDIGEIRALLGGISSDIATVELAGRKLCVKAALEQLKVPQIWKVPVSRNLAEYRWYEFAAGIVPNSAPALFGHSETENGFAMEYLAGKNTYCWKDALLSGAGISGEAIGVAKALGRLHAASSELGPAWTGFQNRDVFDAIRLDPYLRFTATKYSDLSEGLIEQANNLYAATKTLVHGDVSPKNILIHNGQPVLLDAECATVGDPCFDTAFCLNHLVLKSVHLPDNAGQLLESARAFWMEYRNHVTWEDHADIEQRTARLLPAMMLARIDGKSPVEYLSEPARQRVRSVSIALLSTKVQELETVFSTLAKSP